jgi:hypothetical protein
MREEVDGDTGEDAYRDDALMQHRQAPKYPRVGIQRNKRRF